MSSCLHVSLIPARVLTVLLQVIIALPISVISANFKAEYDKMEQQNMIKKSQQKKVQLARKEVRAEVGSERRLSLQAPRDLHNLYLSSILNLCRPCDAPHPS